MFLAERQATWYQGVQCKPLPKHITSGWILTCELLGYVFAHRMHRSVGL